jgi:hypothetical protein
MVSKPTRLATRWLLENFPLGGKFESSIDSIWDALGMVVRVDELFLGLTQHQKSCTTL